jgi:DNA-binding MarR family transcriptional regulator
MGHKTMTHTPRLASLPTWLLSEAAVRSHRVLHEHLARADVSGYEYRALATLGDLGRISQADLGRASRLDRRDVTDTVRKLESRGFVSRALDPHDTRRILVELTASGRRTVKSLDAMVHDVQKEVLKPLTAVERRLLVDLLRRLS